jgi:hypothetical protein
MTVEDRHRGILVLGAFVANVPQTHAHTYTQVGQLVLVSELLPVSNWLMPLLFALKLLHVGSLHRAEFVVLLSSGTVQTRQIEELSPAESKRPESTFHG